MKTDTTAIDVRVEPERSLALAVLEVVKAPGWGITSDAHAEQVGALLVAVKQKYNAIADFKKEVLGPFQNAIRNANAAFARGLDPLQEAERALKVGINVFEAKREAERLAAMRAAEPVPPPPPKLAGITQRVERRFRIVDAERVPKQFCSPDEAKIKEHLRNGGIEAIPGVEFYDEVIKVVR